MDFGVDAGFTLELLFNCSGNVLGANSRLVSICEQPIASDIPTHVFNVVCTNSPIETHSIRYSRSQEISGFIVISNHIPSFLPIFSKVVLLILSQISRHHLPSHIPVHSLIRHQWLLVHRFLSLTHLVELPILSVLEFPHLPLQLLCVRVSLLPQPLRLLLLPVIHRLNPVLHLVSVHQVLLLPNQLLDLPLLHLLLARFV